MEVRQDQVLSSYLQQLEQIIAARLVINSWEISDTNIPTVTINKKKKKLKIK